MPSWDSLSVIVEQEVKEKVDWLSDRIQPFVLFQMPDGGWIEFSMGIFIPSTPTREDKNGMMLRKVEAYDGLVILEQDKFTERTAFAKGTAYSTAVTSLLKGAGITKINIRFPTGAILPNDKEWGIGDSKLTAVNDLLTEVNMASLWVDVDGYFVSYPYESPADKAADYLYSDQELSIIFEGVEEELDLFETPNSWIVTVTNPDTEEVLTARKTNTNPDSLTSIPSRGRTIVDFREVDDIANQVTLNAYIERIAFESSQVYGRLKFKTPIMPFHDYYDVIGLSYQGLGLDEKFAEMNWTIDMTAGGQMTHELRKVVTV